MVDTKPNMFIINIHPESWEACVKSHIFGLRKGSRHPVFSNGDIFLVRRTGLEYGVTGIWLFSEEEEITDLTRVPWTDAEYTILLSFDKLVDFESPVSEQFIGVSKFSEKLQMPAMRIIGSVVQLADAEIVKYIELILAEKAEQCLVEAVYQGRRIKVAEILNSLVSQYKEIAEKPLPPPRKKRRGIISGEPIDFRGMVYAPLNEAGVVLLFSKVMDDLGVIYESSPLKGFDMVGRIKTEQGFELKHFEFEYKSSNFKSHEHDPSMVDYLVCWEHDWTKCPEELEVWELREIIKDLPAEFK